ncbi:MAG TPA: hypothetical protein PLB24_03970 [Comamonas denitrificans]|nr:hypothetical protein [Comamonas denitrificans]
MALGAPFEAGDVGISKRYSSLRAPIEAANYCVFNDAAGMWQARPMHCSGFVAQIKFLAEKYRNSEKYCVTIEARIFR